ncbi:uncharacterized protein Z520_09307 [Fonsecaea multimorphosa CBS 102226]|uniref:Uncharacterized protein n=1 Tax=Fonsecaea multimorphosa CBS 102226 TaxID=1442371 RepID=A0A0D2JNV0_9EURO|nr:uncharacterized protein Z520_09307 [Fonsecaea multimorphosa CBS 102226]KIX94997.1 hypothetical protein Z520_09307 [Fonsecaea multimorphosa CBS 102226]OAL20646.1 hypothetical protein AYO22_08655 [Fonsecaea multimorphosa]
MPITQGFEFLIEGVDGVPFTNYGTRSLGPRIISTKIQAKNGVRFNIRIKPQAPFPDPDNAPLGRSRYNLRSSAPPAEVAGGRDGMDYESSRAAADEVVYVAYVHVDGNKKPECTSVIVVDPEDSGYSSKGCLLDGRYSLADDATTQDRSDEDSTTNISISPWVFSERGIDVLMGRMDISTADPDIPSTAMEQELADLTQAMSKDSLYGAAEEKRGEIEVKIVRVVDAGGVCSDAYWKRGKEESPKDDDGKTHDITIDKDQEQRVSMVTCRYRRYREDEAFLCKAKFQYMDIAKLVNLGLCNTKGEPIERRQNDAVGQPLAISSSGHDSRLGQSKRVRGLEREQAKQGELDLARYSSSEEEGSASDTTSDSDVPRRKRRGASKRGKATASKEKKTLRRPGPAKVNASADNLSMVPKLGDKARVANFLQLEPASNNREPETDAAIEQLQLVKADFEGKG